MDSKDKSALVAVIPIDDDLKTACLKRYLLKHGLHVAAAAVVAASNLTAEPLSEDSQVRVKIGAA